MREKIFFKNLLIVSIFFVFISNTKLVIAGEIILAVEEPTSSSTYTGVSNIRGWTTGSAGIKVIQLYMDGVFLTNIPSGGVRSDVGSQYPTYPNSRYSGFSMAFNYSNLAYGPHNLIIKVIDEQGYSQENNIVFNVIKFHNSYISDPTKIDLSNSNFFVEGKSINIKNVLIDGKLYNLLMAWRTETQGFSIIKIESLDVPSPN